MLMQLKDHLKVQLMIRIIFLPLHNTAHALISFTFVLTMLPKVLSYQLPRSHIKCYVTP